MTRESLIAPARLARRPVLASQRDERLVDLVRAGYEPAFEAIVARYRGPLLRYVERFLPRERAEDAVQQSFVKAYESMVGGRCEINLRPWLYRIAHNTALNALRDRALRHGDLPEAIDRVERPDEALERAQGLREVLAAVQALPPRQRDAIVLRELEGRSYEEIAAELGVSGGSVRQLLNRARNTLRAAASALTPVGLAGRLPWAASSEPVAARVAELCGAAGAGAAVAKLCATGLVTGAVVGSVALAPAGGSGERAMGSERAAVAGGAAGGGPLRAAAGGAPGGFGVGARRGDDGATDRHGGGDRSRPGSGGDSGGSGSGSGGSGSGSGGSGSGSGDSGSGSGDSGSGSSGSGSGSSGSGSASSGSGSGSGSSGSGSSASGSGSGTEPSGSGSGSSGSGSYSSGSGSGSSGGGSGGDSSGTGSGDGLDHSPTEGE